jgi:uncharacterized protein (TIGR02246 family)
MITEQKTTDQIVRSVMDEWRAGIDAHDPGRVAAVFAWDTVFQGLRPYVGGQPAVAQYYDSQPAGMAVTYEVLESRRPTDDVAIGYLRATFTFVDRPPLPLNIGVTLVRNGDQWQVVQYQASRVD